MSDTPGARFDRLVAVMRTLRGAQGCAWDRQQTLQTLRPFVLEETYELLDTLDRGDMAALREELGDFLYEAVFLAQIADEEGHFSIAEPIQAIVDKLVRRHPHVFTPDGRPLAEAHEAITPQQVKERWEDLKARERQRAGAAEKTLLSGIPKTLPALLRAYEIGTRVGHVGFDWPTVADVVGKIEEEVAELRAAVTDERHEPARAEDEMGDLLFAIANLARKMGIEPESALRRANEKFQQRFDELERRVHADGRQLRDASLEELETYWQRAKSDVGPRRSPRPHEPHEARDS